MLDYVVKQEDLYLLSLIFIVDINKLRKCDFGLLHISDQRVDLSVGINKVAEDQIIRIAFEFSLQ